MPPLVDITNRRFGKLVAIERVGTQNGNATWLCQCDCGNTKVIKSNNLLCGLSKTCGCSQIESIIFRSTTHGLVHSSEYSSWRNMINRCYYRDGEKYSLYGGQGVIICEEWLISFKSFYDDMGPKPSEHHTIDRIDNSKGYYKENCRWVTPSQQAGNRRTSIIVELNGKSMSLKEACVALDLAYRTILTRFRKYSVLPEGLRLIQLPLPRRRNVY